MNHRVVAWMLDCGSGTVVAVSASNMLHVVEDAAQRFRVPLAPAHCNQVLVWQQRVLPIVDLAVLLTASAPVSKKIYSCVLGWRAPGDITEYGVFSTCSLPRRVLVTDDKAVTPTITQAELWRDIALGFFSYHGHSTPIVDPAAVFGSRQSAFVSRAEAVNRIA